MPMITPLGTGKDIKKINIKDFFINYFFWGDFILDLPRL
jgi:hypothetical protein